ncbi:hypothetical protein D9757_007032 [Collybiopsis confluens]|uniref:Histone deacetylase interacting domain-containing protein n=1 Tax=Collybiopsis confluens TaxID=2823264 RepID=A0A8H5HCB5_9AGAR|nr:hypothetical protein D9757_007032 [Collybiopsis confluens]
MTEGSSEELKAVAADAQDVEMAEETTLPLDVTRDDEDAADSFAHDRPLNVTDALSYLDAVKNKFSSQPNVYNHFLDIMKEFKSQQHVFLSFLQPFVTHVLTQNRYSGRFNTFLPVGYRIECSVDANHITVTTPRGSKMETHTAGRGQPFQWSDEAPEHRSPVSPLPKYPERIAHSTSRRATPDFVLPAPQAMEPAVAYVQKIKQRCDEGTYRQFLDILSRYHHSPESINEVIFPHLPRLPHPYLCAHLFKDAPDLRSDFRIFMPDGTGQSLLDDNAMAEEGRYHRDRDHHDSKSRRKLESADSGGSLLPQKRKRKAGERDGVGGREKERREIVPTKISANKNKKHKTDSTRPPVTSSAVAPATLAVAPTSSTRMQMSSSQVDPSLFFDRVKRALDSRETYNEFLKVVNLFTQGYIDIARLVKESRNFLVGDGDLMKAWKEILGWDSRKEEETDLTGNTDRWIRPTVVDGVIERPLPIPGKVDLSARFGSYRRLPSSEIHVTCSGRDSMCRDVLNDEWVSHPTWALNSSSYVSASSSNNGSGTVAYPDPFDDPTLFWSVSRKNPYEEALHRSEEERHEYDFHIEAISRTIGAIEPISNKIKLMSPEEKGSFRLKPNLGGSAKAIHQRVIRKIYGREHGSEVIACMQESPAQAIPVVLERLKQKEEEWKRAQREWNKVWREVDARNYAKSLDHQSVNFKAADKKALTTKVFVSEIEAAREEQMASRAVLIDPLFARTRPRHQLEITFEDLSVLQDSLKLVFSFLDRTQGQISYTERRRIEAFLRGWVPLVFMIDAASFNAAFSVVQEFSGAEAEMDIEGLGLLDVDQPLSSSSRLGAGRSKKAGSGVSGGDLRKKLLKSEQAKSGRKTRAGGGGQPSPSISRFVSPAPSGPGERISKMTPATNRNRGIFFTNTTFYVLLRLLGVLYSRLRLFKTMERQEGEPKLPSLSSERFQVPSSAFSDPSHSMISNVRGSSNPEQPGDIVTTIESTLIASPALKESITEAVETTQPFSEREYNVAEAHSYDVLLQNCERLFDNEIEQGAFEDQMRLLFGVKHAYKIFTIDKLIGTIIKQVQVVFLDQKSQELLEILKRDRAVPSPTTQDQINNRRNTEKVLGPDENLFRIDWLPETRNLTVQLIGKDDTSYDDSEVLTGRWQTYVDSYVSNESTQGVTLAKIKKPYLSRNLPRTRTFTEPEIIGSDALEIKVCIRTYRLFYVADTEDYLCTGKSARDYTSIVPTLQKRDQARREWIERNKTASQQQPENSSASGSLQVPTSVGRDRTEIAILVPGLQRPVGD